MKISEIFYSIQGEGKYTGVPSVFIRLAGCNLACTWCDTPYALEDSDSTELSIDDILNKTTDRPSPFFVITGGEPMISKELPELTRRLKENGKHITIETNATIAPNDIPCDFASLSPKLKHSTGELPHSHVIPDIIQQWITRYPYQLKFVVKEPDDVSEINDILSQLDTDIAPSDVLLMPEQYSTEHIAWIIEACKQHGFRYCHRLQRDLFSDQKGH